ncbi:MAG TPA: DNA-directed RNA polymerase subunit omega [Candidatus Acidoferrales bacterium]|nr:DNA-directed RNA polymerase subunit omega [Candidatus Acidoferrales bacterium]
MPVSTQAPESQFAYVVVVSQRARQLMLGGRPLVENPRARKYTRIAEEELRQGLLEFEAPESNVETDGEAKKRKE